MSWKEETCEFCEYRVGSICRQSPPDANTHEYPQVRWDVRDKMYTDACSQYLDKEYM